MEKISNPPNTQLILLLRLDYVLGYLQVYWVSLSFQQPHYNLLKIEFLALYYLYLKRLHCITNEACVISGQNANDKMPLPKTPIQKNAHPNPKTPHTKISGISCISI